MNTYILPRQLPEIRSLTADQQRGVMRRFFSERYLSFAGLLAASAYASPIF
jgi:hypothetical protein